MKKIIGLVLVGIFFMIPVVSHADTSQQALLNEIQTLLKTVQNLQAQVAQLKGAVANTSTSSNVAVTVNTQNPSCISLGVNLSLGNHGKDVSKLQKFLRGEGDFTYPTNTGYFGSETENAVKHWQASHGVVSSGTPISTGYGVVGPQTEREIENQSCAKSSEDKSASITSEKPDISHTKTSHVQETGDSTSTTKTSETSTEKSESSDKGKMTTSESIDKTASALQALQVALDGLMIHLSL